MFPGVHIALWQLAILVLECRSAVQVQEVAVKRRSAEQVRKLPISWGDYEFASLQDHSADDLDRRLRDMSLESEDQRVALEMVLRRTIDGLG